jgi:hypothetical protein
MKWPSRRLCSPPDFPGNRPACPYPPEPDRSGGRFVSVTPENEQQKSGVLPRFPACRDFAAGPSAVGQIDRHLPSTEEM